MDTETARRRLTEMLEDLERSTRTLEGEHAGEDDGELSSNDQHPADSATDLSDRDREDALLETVQSQREQVQAALQRLDEGTYGRCVVCGKELSEDRLEARPEAARCLEDQEKMEAAR